MNDEGLDLRFFGYTHDPIVLAAAIGNTGSATITTDAEASFAVNYITVAVMQAGVIVLNWGGTIQLTQQTPGWRWFNSPVPVDSLRGTGGLPYPLNPAKAVPASSTVTVDLTNNIATATTVQVTLHGNKVFASYERMVRSGRYRG